MYAGVKDKFGVYFLYSKNKSITDAGVRLPSLSVLFSSFVLSRICTTWIRLSMFMPAWVEHKDSIKKCIEFVQTRSAYLYFPVTVVPLNYLLHCTGAVQPFEMCSPTIVVNKNGTRYYLFMKFRKVGNIIMLGIAVIFKCQSRGETWYATFWMADRCNGNGNSNRERFIWIGMLA